MNSIHRIIAYGTLLMATPMPAFAQYGIPGVGTSAQPLTLYKVVKIVEYTINTLLGIALTIVIAMLVYNGFRMATARGNQTKFTEAQKGLWHAIIGLTVTLGVGVILATIGSFARNPASVIR